MMSAAVRCEESVSKTAARFSRRLLELGREFDKNPTMKYLLVRPPTALARPEQMFYDKVFANRSRFLPLHYPEKTPITPEIRTVSFQKTIRELLESPKLKNIHEEEQEKSMWNVFKTMLNVITCYENMPTKGYIYDEKFTTYTSEPVRKYILNARERLANKNDKQLVRLSPVDVGMALVSHPLRFKEYWRNTVVQTYNFQNGAVSGILMNSYKRIEDILRREGGCSQAGFTIQLSDLAEIPNYDPSNEDESKQSPLTARGMAVSFRVSFYHFCCSSLTLWLLYRKNQLHLMQIHSMALLSWVMGYQISYEKENGFLS